MKNNILIVFLFLGMISCETGLDKTVFLPDENDRNLPAYTEWGYNSFGAKYERSYFVASNNIVPCKITCKDGQINFFLLGYQTGTIGYNYNEANRMSLLITFPFSIINDYTGLLGLHEQTMDISNEGCSVSKANADEQMMDLEILSGELCFKRAQLLRIDGEVDRVILSGTFTIRFLNHGRPETISDGRFDVGIYDKDFYSFDNY